MERPHRKAYYKSIYPLKGDRITKFHSDSMAYLFRFASAVNEPDQGTLAATAGSKGRAPFERITPGNFETNKQKNSGDLPSHLDRVITLLLFLPPDDDAVPIGIEHCFRKAV